MSDPVVLGPGGGRVIDGVHAGLLAQAAADGKTVRGAVTPPTAARCTCCPSST